jgi:hypothetical protein
VLGHNEKQMHYLLMHSHTILFANVVKKGWMEKRESIIKARFKMKCVENVN